MAFTSPAMQLDFWTELAALLTTRDLRAPKPSTRSHCYVGIGTSLGKLVLTAPTAEGGVACKLALDAKVTPARSIASVSSIANSSNGSS